MSDLAGGQALSDNDGGNAAPVVHASMAEKKRRRPPLACEQCRKRKIKCDRNSPCGHCTRARIPDCTYAPTHVPAASKTKRNLSSVLPTTSTINASQRPVRPAPSQDANIQVGDGSELPTNTLPPSKASSSVHSSNVESASDSSNVDWLIARVHELEDKLANVVHISEPKGSGPFTPSKGDTIAPLSGTISKTRYFGNSHWFNVTDLVCSLT